MNSISIYLVLRLLSGFVVGGILAKRLQDPMRKLILKLTPMRKRLSPQYYLKQTRVVNGISIVLAIGLSLLFNYGWTQIAHQWNQSFPTTIIKNPSPKPAPPVKVVPPPSQLTIIQPTNYQTDEVSIPDQYEQLSIAPTPSVSYIPRAKDHRTPKTPKSINPTEGYFLQIGAFTTLENAQDHQATWPFRSRYHRWIGIATYDDLPFKVLLGPFVNRTKANQYLRRKNFNGFPVAGEDYLLHH